MEALTDDDLAMLREAQERLRERAPVASAAPPPSPLRETLGRAVPLPRFVDAGAAARAAGEAFGAVPRGEPVPPANRCQGGCGAVVVRRAEWCPACAEDGRRRARELEVIAARETFSPGGAAAWCRPGDPKYAAAVAKAAAAAPPEMARIITHAAWKRDMGSTLILGPTDYGKTRVLCAIGNRVLDYAVKVGWSQPEIMRFARGVRYVSALDIGRARSQSKWTEPEIVREAKGATLLLLDEFGWEEQRFDPHAVRDVFRARFDPVWKPTIVASGKTYEQLAETYGEPTLRMLTCRGLLVDLHPRKAA